MKVAITGAGGYVGSLLVHAHAARGDHVHATARRADSIPRHPNVTATIGDITHADLLPDSFFDGVDVVYHCAAEIANERVMSAVNVAATNTLLERARGRIAHWVQLSSLSVYGAPRTGVIDEDSAVAPRTLYGRSKAQGDECVRRCASNAFSYTIVRPSAVIGPRMRTRSIQAMIEAVRRGRFCFIGEPGAIGNYIHEDNAVAALMLCGTGEAARNRTYNLAQNCTIEEMVRTIASELGIEREPARIPEMAARALAQIARLIPSFPLTPSRVDALTSRVRYPTTRIEGELDYRHERTVNDALRELIALEAAP